MSSPVFGVLNSQDLIGSQDVALEAGGREGFTARGDEKLVAAVAGDCYRSSRRRWARRFAALSQLPCRHTNNNGSANSDCHRRVQGPPSCGRGSSSTCSSLLLFRIV